MRSRFNFRYVIALSFWVMLGIGTIVLLVAAINKRNHKHCTGVDITISGVQNHYFIDKEDVNEILQKAEPAAKGRPINSFDLARLERLLGKNEWIKSAELYFDNNEVLRINIVEREPVARIFTVTGKSFYIDTALTRLSLSDKLSPRLPVFTNFPEGKTLSRSEIDLLRSIRDLASYIVRDSFWMAQIEQVDIASDRTFEMIPKVGNQVILFGDATNHHEKFNNLLLFYRNVMTKVGWNKYSKINLQYKGQIIGVKRGAADIIEDSIRSLQIMREIIAKALKQADDSLSNIQLVQPEDDASIPPPPDFGYGITEEDQEPVLVTKNQPVANVEVQMKTTLPERKPKAIVQAPVKATAKQTIIKKPLKQKPKAVMPPANDY